MNNPYQDWDGDSCEQPQCRQLGAVHCAHCSAWLCLDHAHVIIGTINERAKYLCEECQREQADSSPVQGD